MGEWEGRAVGGRGGEWGVLRGLVVEGLCASWWLLLGWAVGAAAAVGSPRTGLGEGCQRSGASRCVGVLRSAGQLTCRGLLLVCASRSASCCALGRCVAPGVAHGWARCGVGFCVSLSPSRPCATGHRRPARHPRYTSTGRFCGTSLVSPTLAPPTCCIGRAPPRALWAVCGTRKGFLPLFPCSPISSSTSCVPQRVGRPPPGAVFCCCLFLERSMADVMGPPPCGHPAAAPAVVSSTHATLRVGAAPPSYPMPCDARGGCSRHGWGARRGHHWSVGTSTGSASNEPTLPRRGGDAGVLPTRPSFSAHAKPPSTESSTMLCCLSRRLVVWVRGGHTAGDPKDTEPHPPRYIRQHGDQTAGTDSRDPL